MDAQRDGHEEERIGASGCPQGLDDRGVIGFDLDHEEVQADPGLNVGRTAGSHKDVLRVLAVDRDASVRRQVDERTGVSQKTHFHSKRHRKNLEGGLARLARKVQEADFESKPEVGGEPAVDLQSTPVTVSDQIGELEASGDLRESKGVIEDGKRPYAQNGHSGARNRRGWLIRFGRTGMGEKVPDRVAARLEAVKRIAAVSVGPGLRIPEENRSQDEENGTQDSPIVFRHAFP